MVEDPRAALGSWIGLRMVAGVKAVRYLLSPRYRRRLQLHWRDYPTRRPHHIRMMIAGVILDVFIVWVLAMMLLHR